jgi:site-specific recombinase XerD
MEILKKDEMCFFQLFNRFIKDTRKGKRLRKDGKRISAGTVKNYESVLKLLNEFDSKYDYGLRVKDVKRFNKPVYQKELKYWTRFYKRFMDFLYSTKGQHDNTVGSSIKIIVAFFNYLKVDKGIFIGEITGKFYIPHEERPIVVFSPQRLHFLMYNKEFEDTLPHHLKVTKDILVFGCTVGLRYSDLAGLNARNLRNIGGKTYLIVNSNKTNAETKILLPGHAMSILKKYEYHSRRKKKLLPMVALSNFNIAVKKLCRMAGWTELIAYQRAKRGEYQKTAKLYLPFYKVVSSHIMRRTAITTLLTMGMPELMVRKISGHSNNSSSFYRYVNFVQDYQDEQTEKAFSKLNAIGETG